MMAHPLALQPHTSRPSPRWQLTRTPPSSCPREQQRDPSPAPRPRSIEPPPPTPAVQEVVCAGDRRSLKRSVLAHTSTLRADSQHTSHITKSKGTEMKVVGIDGTGLTGSKLVAAI